MNQAMIENQGSHQSEPGGLNTAWLQVRLSLSRGERKTAIIPIAMNLQGIRIPSLEKRLEEVYLSPLRSGGSTQIDYEAFMQDTLEPALFREMKQRWRSQDSTSYSTTLIGWIEIG